MDPATAIAQDIHATEGKSSYDEACKKLLSNKIILAWIMKSCIEEYRDIAAEEIAEKYIEGSPAVGEDPVFPDEKPPLIQGMDTVDKSIQEQTITYDIRFQATAPVSGEIIGFIINVEAQGKFNPGYPLLKRGIYYCSRLISAQYNREFTDFSYRKLKKVYSIWVCMDSPENRKNTVTSYQMTEKNLIGSVKEPIVNYDLLSVIMICPAGPEADNYEGILKLLHTLLSNETSETEKREVLEDEFHIQMTREMESEVSAMCNLSQLVEEKGIQKGIEKGIEKGIQKGIEEERVSSLKKLVKNRKMTIDESLEVLEIPKTDWPKYHKLLADQ